MTRERRLAIQMWEEIKDAIIKAKRSSDIDEFAIIRLKSKFCADHDLNWRCYCWFCAYVRYLDPIYGEGCQRCPLSSGSKGAILGYSSGCGENAYRRAINAKWRKTRIKACDEIIATLKGETYGKRKSTSGNGRSIRRNDTKN